MTKQYRVEVYDTKDGAASFAIVRVMRGGQWINVGQTGNRRVYPRSVRARTAGHNMVKKLAGKTEYTITDA